MVNADFRDLERCRKIENRLTMLNRHNPPGSEAAAVADPLDLVDDARRLVARPEKVGVKGTDTACRVEGHCGGHQRLAEHLAAKHDGAADVVGDAPKQIVFKTLDPQRVHQFVDAVVHRGSPLPMREPVRLCAWARWGG